MGSGELHPFQLPNEEERNRTEEEEDKFLKEELISIRKEREKVKNNSLSNNNYSVSLLSILHIRQIYSLETEETLFSRTARRSRHKNVELYEIPFTPNVSKFFQELLSVLKMVKGEYIYLGTNNIHIDESFFSTAIDYLEESKDGYAAWRSAVWICNKEQRICAECFTERNDTDIYEECKKIDPVFEDISTLFACFIWKTNSLIELIHNLMIIQKEFPVNISEFFFILTISKDAIIKIVKSQVPNVTIYK